MHRRDRVRNIPIWTNIPLKPTFHQSYERIRNQRRWRLSFMESD
jgi:hypothetical protein